MAGLKPSSGLTYALKYAAETLAGGIGQSRREAEKAHGGQSPFIHSSDTHNRYFKVGREFFKEYCPAQGIRSLDKITQSSVADFLQRHIDAGAEKNTIKTEISALNKILVDGCGRTDLLIKNGGEIWRQAQDSGHQTHKFDHPGRVLEEIRNPVSRAIAEIEYHTSARIAETKNIRIDEEEKASVSQEKGERGGRLTTETEWKNLKKWWKQKRRWNGTLKATDGKKQESRRIGIYTTQSDVQEKLFKDSTPSEQITSAKDTKNFLKNILRKVTPKEKRQPWLMLRQDRKQDMKEQVQRTITGTVNLNFQREKLFKPTFQPLHRKTYTFNSPTITERTPPRHLSIPDFQASMMMW